MSASTDIYRFYRHRQKPQFRLVLKAQLGFPPETAEGEWELTRQREGEDVNRDVRREIDEKGYSLFKIGVTFAELSLSKD